MKSINSKLLLLILCLTIVACSTQKGSGKHPLFDTLWTSNEGGASIKFYEILTEPKEIKMLLNDPSLKKKIKEEDIEKCNFIILNMGSLPKGNYSIQVTKVVEEEKDIIVYVNESIPQPLNKEDELENVAPYTVVKINSKKNIIIKEQNP